MPAGRRRRLCARSCTFGRQGRAEASRCASLRRRRRGRGMWKRVRECRRGGGWRGGQGVVWTATGQRRHGLEPSREKEFPPRETHYLTRETHATPGPRTCRPRHPPDQPLHTKRIDELCPRQGELQRKRIGTYETNLRTFSRKSYLAPPHYRRPVRAPQLSPRTPQQLRDTMSSHTSAGTHSSTRTRMLPLSF